MVTHDWLRPKKKNPNRLQPDGPAKDRGRFARPSSLRTSSFGPDQCPPPSQVSASRMCLRSDERNSSSHSSAVRVSGGSRWSISISNEVAVEVFDPHQRYAILA